VPEDSCCIRANVISNWHCSVKRVHLTQVQLAALIALGLLVSRGFASIASWHGNVRNETKFSSAEVVSMGLGAATEIGQTGFTPSVLTPPKPATEESVALLQHRRKNLPAVRFPSPDCNGFTPKGYSRIFIAYRTDTEPGDGTAREPFDGSSPQKFDALLRARSERGVTHLVVCIGPGTFQTEGAHDYLLGRGHLDRVQPAGFTVNQSWKVHGAGIDQTVLQLTDLYLDRSSAKYLPGLIIGTYDLNSYGIEVSDLTLDDNYPTLKARYKTKLQLQAIFIQSNRGQHWIHHIHVMNPAGELAEDFPIEIGSPAPSPTESTGSVVEHVTLDHWGAGECTAIAIANSVSEVRFNTVIGYWGAFGGWQMSDVQFHDNSAIETVYGFNVDSLYNKNVLITHNQIVHPQRYGVVVGGIGQFLNFSISDNTITLAKTVAGNTLFGFILQSNVTGARVTGNRIITDQSPSPTDVVAVYEKGDHNTGNVFQANQISTSFRISLKSPICAYGNINQSGGTLRELGDTQMLRCVPGA
jgi:hypothetical protein